MRCDCELFDAVKDADNWIATVEDCRVIHEWFCPACPPEGGCAGCLNLGSIAVYGCECERCADLRNRVADEHSRVADNLVEMPFETEAERWADEDYQRMCDERMGVA